MKAETKQQVAKILYSCMRDGRICCCVRPDLSCFTAQEK